MEIADEHVRRTFLPDIPTPESTLLPLELIAMYPWEIPVPTKRQQTGDNLAEKEGITVGTEAPHGDNNSICVNDLIFFYW